LQALHARLDQQILGYSVAGPDVREAIVADLWAKYAWRVQPDELLFLPGVEPGFNMALHAFVQPGQPVVLQTPTIARSAWRPATGTCRVSKCRSN
jgi:cystathionine beta-lyase